jgi:hypothetical protein
VQPPATSSLLGPNIPLSTLFSDTLSQFSTLTLLKHNFNQQDAPLTASVLVLDTKIFRGPCLVSHVFRVP